MPKDNYPIWIQTYTGREVNPLKIKPEDICIEDIGHSLANLCRFNGHCKFFYSVAEHSLIMSLEAASPQAALYALLHNATECYLSDIPSPIKWALPEVEKIETNIMGAVVRHFNLSVEPIIMSEVKRLDREMLCTEKSQLMYGEREFECCEGVKLLDINLPCLSPVAAEHKFLERFKELTGGK